MRNRQHHGQFLNFSRFFHRRRTAPCGKTDADSGSQQVRLADLHAGDHGSVVDLHGGMEFIARMTALGFTPGAEVEVAQNDGRGPLLSVIRGTRIALGRGAAFRITVKYLPRSPSPEPHPEAIPPKHVRPSDQVVVAIAGQPNSGKSTVFNLLTGLSQHVGNWPGKTIEQKRGTHRTESRTLELVDLPGTYSLSAHSPEECVARDFIVREQPDLVVAVVNAATLERHLYLLSELLVLPVPVVLGLNMMDVAEAQGLQIDVRALEQALGLPVIPMVASRNQGIRELVTAIEQLLDKPDTFQPVRPAIRADHQSVLEEVHRLTAGSVPEPYPPDWAALKLLEGDSEITEVLHSRLAPADWEAVQAVLMAHEDAVVAIAGGRYAWIGKILRAAVKKPRAGQITLTEKMDRLAIHPVGGFLILLGILGAAFGLTFSIGVPLQEALDLHIVQAVSDWAHTALAGAPWWLRGLLVDGAWAGAGMVLTFAPVLAVFFAILGFLEDTGYMARAAYVTDRFMHAMGLHGKSFLPLCLSLGCNVPGVLCARIIDSHRARILTILLVPFVPCTARLAVLAVLAPLFFGESAVWAALAVLGINLAVLIGTGYALHKLVLGGEHTAFIMELPLYHWPNSRTIGLYIWQHLREFLAKAGTVIVAVSMIIWGISYLPGGDFQSGYLSTFGEWLTPVGRLMGLEWRMVVALLTSVVAKENTLAALSVLYQIHDTTGGLSAALSGAITPAAGLAFLVVQMTFIPCIATLAAIKQETRSWKWTFFSVALMTIVSLVAGALVYRIGLLF
ncbi:MAG: ferrous iron transport protein B [Anaerolineales bacterium]|nr:ferrous iron transport protein B [Anaerolineales bacterium]